MKTKLHLLFTVLFFTMSGVLFGQEPNRSLVITEWRADAPHNAYIELTNMGNAVIDLSEFTLGLMTNVLGGFQGQPAQNIKRLDGTLQPGQTYLIASVVEGSDASIAPLPIHKPRIVEKADLKIYLQELDWRLQLAGLTVAEDSVSLGFYGLTNAGGGIRAHFLFHRTSPEDSVLIDGVGLAFHPETNQLLFAQYMDVAGVTGATATHILVRKFSVKEGNPDWLATRGATPEESQWIPIPYRTGWVQSFSGEYTLAGNHGVYTINSNSVKVKPDVAMDIDFVSRVITVPWGTYRDSLYRKPWDFIDFGNGLAWWENLSPVKEDSAHAICRTGDIYTLFAVGNALQQVDFTVQVAPPTNDMNQIFPLRTINSLGFYNQGQYYTVTQNDPVIDSILGVPFALRVDTLLKRLEIAPNASWEIEWVDGNVRPDVKFGDKIKVKAADNSVKEYFIAVDDYQPSSNALLSAITWPDIPGYLKGVMGWNGDTIPNFAAGSYNYDITVPFGVNQIPALVTQTQNTNARVEVERAMSLTGSLSDRTTTFRVYAEDDSTMNIYRVVFRKEIIQAWVQPFKPDPFFSQILRYTFHENMFTEVFNPGNQDLDLSRYMFSLGAGVGGTPLGVIEADLSFANRYNKYIPGYKFSDDPAVYEVDKMLRKDLSVNPIVKPGDVWIFGSFITGGREDRRMPQLEATTDFHLSVTIPNVWGIPYGELTGTNGVSHVSRHVARRWPLYLYRIDNDSVLNGTKLPNDPADFTLVDVFGRYGDDNTGLYDPFGTPIPNQPSFAGLTATRKPHIWRGNPESGGSFSPKSAVPNEALSEWKDLRIQHWYDASTTPLSQWEWCSEGLGSHYMDPITVYKSTISSNNYLVSDGYTDGQTIRGIPSGTTGAQMLLNIIKADEGQELSIRSTTDGTVKASEDFLANNDTLVVTSADMVNQTRYILDVGNPLDNNAVITSSVYQVSINGSEGEISGMAYGTAINSVLNNITVPPTAVLNIINQHNALVPLKKLNSDTVLVQTQVHSDIYFEVVAQNGSTIITYRLMPQSGSDDAFVVSDVYEVNQELFFINFINNNTAVPKLMEDVIPANGASMRVLDKFGFERELGYLAYDDILEVTSQSGNVKNFYFLGFKVELELLRNDAYVVSSVYIVNQVSLIIAGVDASVSVTNFKSAIIPAAGASFIVTDENDVELSTGNMSNGYKVKVTAEDGLKTITYLVSDLVGLYNPDARQITLYPNPTNDILYVNGLVQGDYIRVFNIVGGMMKMIPFEQFAGHISLKHFQPGMYFIEVNSRERAPQIFKVYKK